MDGGIHYDGFALLETGGEKVHGAGLSPPVVEKGRRMSTMLESAVELSLGRVRMGMEGMMAREKVDVEKRSWQIGQLVIRVGRRCNASEGSVGRSWGSTLVMLAGAPALLTTRT